jgi:hypothetical protein
MAGLGIAFRLFALLPLVLVLGLACSSNQGSDEAEVKRIEEAVSSFLQEAYSADGDIAFAYSRLASETQRTCSREDFTAIVSVARQANGDRGLQTDRFSDILVTGDTATLKVDSDYDLTPRYFPLDATVEKEGGEWRYLVTTDPTCKSVARFFQHDTSSP